MGHPKHPPALVSFWRVRPPKWVGSPLKPNQKGVPNTKTEARAFGNWLVPLFQKKNIRPEPQCAILLPSWRSLFCFGAALPGTGAGRSRRGTGSPSASRTAAACAPSALSTSPGPQPQARRSGARLGAPPTDHSAGPEGPVKCRINLNGPENWRLAKPPVCGKCLSCSLVWCLGFRMECTR